MAADEMTKDIRISALDHTILLCTANRILKLVLNKKVKVSTI